MRGRKDTIKIRPACVPNADSGIARTAFNTEIVEYFQVVNFHRWLEPNKGKYNTVALH
jgi:hypothetical protein